MTDPDVVVIHVSKGSKKERRRGRRGWTKSQADVKPCFVKLKRLSSEEIGSSTSKSSSKEHQTSNLKEFVAPTPLFSSSPPPKPEFPPFPVKDSPSKDPPIKDTSGLKDVSHKIITLDAKNDPLSQPPAPSSDIPPLPSAPIESSPPKRDFLSDPDQMSSVLINCLGCPSNPNPRNNVFLSLINEHRRECLKCDTQLVQKSPSGGPFQYNMALSSKHRIKELERELKEARMVLKMSEEARAITDLLYENRLQSALEEVNDLKRGIKFLLQKEDGGPHVKELLKPKAQPILEQKERSYFTSCGFNLVNMTALREALMKAQKCGHGNLTLLENHGGRSFLAMRLAFVCLTCHAETLFYSSGFSEATSNFTVNAAVLKTLGEGVFFKLSEFVKHVPFQKTANFVGPHISESNGMRDKVKLILGIDKFNFDQWKDDSTHQEEEEDEVSVVNEIINEKRVVKMKNLEPEVAIQHNAEEDILQEISEVRETPILDRMKLDFLATKNPSRSADLFPELSTKLPKITPRPISELLAPPSLNTGPSLHTANNIAPKPPSLSTENQEKTKNVAVAQIPRIVTVPQPTSALIYPNTLPSKPITPVKIRPSKDLPPGSKILSIPPGTKVMCANVCHSSSLETGLNPGVYRVIDSKNNEKVLIVEDHQQAFKRKRGSNPMVNILNMKSNNVSLTAPPPRIIRKKVPMPSVHTSSSPFVFTSSNGPSGSPALYTTSATSGPEVQTVGIAVPPPSQRPSLPPLLDMRKEPRGTNAFNTNVRTASSRINASRMIQNTIAPETDPLANPQDDPLASSEFPDEMGSLELKSSSHPFIKIVNIFSQKSDKDPVSEEAGDSSIACNNNGIKRMKIGS